MGIVTPQIIMATTSTTGRRLSAMEYSQHAPPSTSGRHNPPHQERHPEQRPREQQLRREPRPSMLREVAGVRLSPLRREILLEIVIVVVEIDQHVQRHGEGEPHDPHITGTLNAPMIATALTILAISRRRRRNDRTS